MLIRSNQFARFSPAALKRCRETEKRQSSRGNTSRGVGGAALFFLAILVVSFGVRAVFFGAHLREAEQLNARLMQKRSEGSAR